MVIEVVRVLRVRVLGRVMRFAAGLGGEGGEVSCRVINRVMMLLSVNVVRVMDVVRKGLGMKVIVIQSMRMLI
ncbi:hypothetical protein Goklo_026413 [Gossypium klotzschianum]|uniref:Uncharacterized protein n=1 Tax=Gossypium klotzschianum TaxID=34286 RepID=A0A7J8TUX2_9ROSI|nr:hypothetical protein [Gossypium klotzschianum]